MADRHFALTVHAEPAGTYNGWYVFLGGEFVGWKPYDGSNAEEACEEVAVALARVVGKELGWKQEKENGEDQ